MRYTYRLAKDPEGIVATCVELPVCVVEATESEALAMLQRAICAHLTHVEAVAPPTSVPVPSVQLAPAGEETREREEPPEPQGPGDSPAAD